MRIADVFSTPIYICYYYYSLRTRIQKNRTFADIYDENYIFENKLL